MCRGGRGLCVGADMDYVYGWTWIMCRGGRGLGVGADVDYV
jgi:hypothetical protein